MGIFGLLLWKWWRFFDERDFWSCLEDRWFYVMCWMVWEMKKRKSKLENWDDFKGNNWFDCLGVGRWWVLYMFYRVVGKVIEYFGRWEY